MLNGKARGKLWNIRQEDIISLKKPAKKKEKGIRSIEKRKTPRRKGASLGKGTMHA